MLGFLDYLKDFEKEDVSKTEQIVKEKWDRTISVIKEAFGEKYTNKEYAVHKIQNEFVKKTPESIDANFLKENMDYIVKKIETLTEGDIKIIINNNEASPSIGCTQSQPVTSTPVVVTGGGMDIEMECVDPTKKEKKGRGRPKKDEKKESVETSSEIIINTSDDTDSIEVLEEKRKAKEKKEKEEKVVKEQETKQEDNIMKTDNTITWKDIEGVTIETVKENTLPAIKAKDKIIVDGKTYQVEEVIQNEKNPSFTRIKVADSKTFLLGEIDSHETETVNEEEEIEPAVGEDVGEEAEAAGAEEPIADAGASEGEEAIETSEEGEKEEVTEEDIEAIEPGDKIIVDGEKYLVIEYDAEEKEVTVEDEDGEEQVFKCEEIEIEEIEKEVDEDEENEEGSDEESSEEVPVEESYDPQGKSIHDDILSAKKLYEMKNSSEGMPKMPQGASVKAGSSISKVNAPQAQGMPKTDTKLPSGGSALKFANAQAEGMPKTTGVDVKEMQKKEKTASGYTQTVGKHTMPQAPNKLSFDKSPTGGSAMKHTMPQAPNKLSFDKLPTGGASIAKVNMPQAQGMPTMPKTVKESYISNANRWLSE